MTPIEQPALEVTDLDYWIALDCWEALEILEARGKTPTPVDVQRILDPAGNDPTVTLAAIEQGMAQVQRWKASTRVFPTRPS
jgi:hypothetical protein